MYTVPPRELLQNTILLRNVAFLSEMFSWLFLTVSLLAMNGHRYCKSLFCLSQYGQPMGSNRTACLFQDALSLKSLPPWHAWISLSFLSSSSSRRHREFLAAYRTAARFAGTKKQTRRIRMETSQDSRHWHATAGWMQEDVALRRYSTVYIYIYVMIIYIYSYLHLSVISVLYNSVQSTHTHTPTHCEITLYHYSEETCRNSLSLCFIVVFCILQVYLTLDLWSRNKGSSWWKRTSHILRPEWNERADLAASVCRCFEGV